ncbi:MAG: hypothetical protein ABL932_10475, partial [Terricaulis sp.]
TLKSTRKLKQLSDDSAGVPRHRTRSYEIELGGKRLAHVMVDYAERGAQPERFRVRIVAQVRK